jgi:hypothetical protein
MIWPENLALSSRIQNGLLLVCGRRRLITRDVFPLERLLGTKYSKTGRDGIASPGLLSANRKRFPISDEPDDNLNDPIDDELDDALMLAAELVAQWTVVVKRADLTEHQVPGADGHGADGNGAYRG